MGQSSTQMSLPQNHVWLDRALFPPANLGKLAQIICMAPPRIDIADEKIHLHPLELISRMKRGN